MIKALLFTIVSILGITLSSCIQEQDEPMTGDRLETIIRKSANGYVKRERNAIQFNYESILMLCVFDENNNRMRIISPIRESNTLTPEHIEAITAANFHSALDARYASSQGVLYAAYIHPLNPLTEEQVTHAISQVANLSKTFGTEYSSGGLTFLGNIKKEDKE